MSSIYEMPSTAPGWKEGRRIMSTIEKALGLLDYFSEDTPEIGLSDFKTLTKYDKGTTHRYLSALREC